MGIPILFRYALRYLQNLKKLRRCHKGTGCCMSRKAKLCLMFPPFLVAILFFYFLQLNVHISPLYVKYRAIMYPAAFNISQECPWKPNPNNSTRFSTPVLNVIARMLEAIYREVGIKSVLRDGSLLDAYRHIAGDKDIDVWMIVPKHMTFSSAYHKIRQILKTSEYRDFSLATENSLVTSFALQYNDWMHIHVKQGYKVGHVDIVVLHETFINDPSTQDPCKTPTDCDPPTGDVQFENNVHLLQTKVMFENLCKCPYMGSELFCPISPQTYLRLKYGDDFMRPLDPVAKETFKNRRKLLYERTFKFIRYIVATFPDLKGNALRMRPKKVISH